VHMEILVSYWLIIMEAAGPTLTRRGDDVAEAKVFVHDDTKLPKGIKRKRWEDGC